MGTKTVVTSEMTVVVGQSLIRQLANVGQHAGRDKDRKPQAAESDGCAVDSPDGMHRLLTELVGLASQTESTHTAPVLELLLGEVLVRTTMCQRDGVDCVVIVLILPQSKTERRVPATLFSGDPFEVECLWHAEEGRHVMVRHLPVTFFKDAVTVLDTIMASTDRVTAWLASAQQRHLRTVSESEK